MKLLNRLISAFDKIVRFWSAPMSGQYVRYIFWRRRFTFYARRVFLAIDLLSPAFQIFEFVKKKSIEATLNVGTR